MGFHICEYCQGNTPETSSGDVRLDFENGNSYTVPDMLPHYVREHLYKPPADFVMDVASEKLVSGSRSQTKGLTSEPVKIGYLQGSFPQENGDTTWLKLFSYILEKRMKEASEAGQRTQTRSL